VQKKLHVALVGLGFGGVFSAIYHRHPDVARLTVCDANPERRAKHVAQFGAADVVDRIEAVLADPSVDAVHLNSGIPDHARQSIAVLDAGKHCACTVPMATTLDEIRAVIAARRRSGKNYMMMETQVYAREFLHACELRDRGVFGRLQFLRGAHYQDMENWPAYWAGLPPMWYATHAIAPCLAFAQARARSVQCLGSGVMRAELREKYGNPFPVETALFDLDRAEPLALEVTRSLFHFAHGYAESFSIYGEDATLEAAQIHRESPVLFTLSKLGAQPGPRTSTTERLAPPDYGHRLPPEIAAFTGATNPEETEKTDARGGHFSVRHGGVHGGSHPHLVHEFVRSIVERRRPAIDEVTAADWTAPGLCAHASALRGGERVEIPTFA
jgi:predicted dehydrogenase